jgi:alanine dehydrogenase
VLVDIAVDQGGCAVTTHPTTHDEPTYLAEGVIHYCVANMPGAFSRTATTALNNVTHPWTALIADKGLAAACQSHPALLTGINSHAGQLTCRPVADAHQLPFTPPARLL